MHIGYIMALRSFIISETVFMTHFTFPLNVVYTYENMVVTLNKNI
jgi:hypothetical protein